MEEDERVTRAGADLTGDPNHDSHVGGDPYKTLFISRLVRIA